MRTKSIYFGLLVLIVLSSFVVLQEKQSTPQIRLVTTQANFKAGSPITLTFSISEETKPMLYCSNSYGSILINPRLRDNTLVYHIPKNISNKTGVVTWRLTFNSTPIQGSFIITPREEVTNLETYVGPPSIEAGGNDYTMMVLVPSDSLDNPVASNTKIDAKHQFLSAQLTDSVFTENLIAHQLIYSKKESGRILISSESLGTHSKEFTVNIAAAIPVDFQISAARPHNYADGNQITTFSTSVLKDKQNNTVSDGTYVTFYIKNSSGNTLKTSGNTVRGIATSKMIHPDFGDNWEVIAYVEGMAESNTLKLTYEQVIKDYPIHFSEENNAIIVGPLLSFMKQLIPDGLQVKLLVFENNKLVETFSRTSKDGYVHFKLTQNDLYTYKVLVAGVEKELPLKN